MNNSSTFIEAENRFVEDKFLIYCEVYFQKNEKTFIFQKQLQRCSKNFKRSEFRGTRAIFYTKIGKIVCQINVQS